MDHSDSIEDLLSKSKLSDKVAGMSLSSKLVSKGVWLPRILFERSTGLFSQKRGSLGSDKWTILERILLSAIKLGDEVWVGFCLTTLRKEFPYSGRVERFVALYKESQADWVEAENMYKSMLMKAPENVYARKRLITCLKAQGRVKDTVGALIDQLEIFSADTELWHELSMVYLSQVSFSKALTAMEELLLSDPKSFYNLLIYSEVLASTGELSLAIKYYCKALEYRPNEPRALWGICTCLSGSKKLDAKDKKLQSELENEVVKRLKAIYLRNETASAKLSLKALERIGSDQ